MRSGTLVIAILAMVPMTAPEALLRGGRPLSPSQTRTPPESAEAHLARARELEKKGDVDAAIDEYISALEIDPGSAATNHHVGALLEKQDERELAFEYYKSATELMQKSGQIRVLAGHSQPVRAVVFSPRGD